MDRPLRSPGGGIQVVTTERGLPMAIKLEPRELTKAPADLAADILRLCQVSAMRAQVARRQEIASRGFTSSVINSLPLATEDELARAEVELRGGHDDDEPPSTWMRSV